MLERIVVTGERVLRNLFETASSVVVVPHEELEEQAGKSSVADILADVPNVVMTDTVGMPVIRGQDTQGPHNGQNVFWGGTVPRATVNVDGHYQNYNEFYFGATSIWDVDSIEVFRGPQTTSQGANAIAGSIIVNTKDPTFTPEGAYQAEIGNYNMKRSSLAISGPVIEDQLAARLALDYTGRDTFIDYVNSGFQQGDANQDFASLSGRLKLLLTPIDLPGFEAKFTYSLNASNRPTQEAASAPFEELEHITTTMPSWKQQTHTGILDLSYDFGNGVAVFNQLQLSTSSVHRVVGVPLNGDADLEQWNASNETRVTFGDVEDALSGMAGLYYAHTRSDDTLYLRGVTDFDDTKRNLGLFGEVSYRLTDQMTVTGGLRFQQDQVQRVGTSSFTRQPLDYDTTFSALLPKVSIAYELTPDWTVGALVSRGYNPGGVSLNLTSGDWMPFKEETVWNYELFTRANLLDDRLFLTANVFYTDFENAQFNIPVEISPGVVQSYTINAEKAYAYGLEAALDYRILDNLTFKAGAGVMRTQIETISDNTALEGNEFAKTPGYMLTLGASWDITEQLNLSGQVRYVDGYHSDVENTPSYWVGPYALADARVSYKVSEQVELYGFVNNIFDERAPVLLKQNRGIGGIEASMTAPRMYGVGVKGSF